MKATMTEQKKSHCHTHQRLIAGWRKLGGVSTDHSPARST